MFALFRLLGQGTSAFPDPLKEFDDTEVRQGLIRVITPFVDSLLAREKVEVSENVWEETENPAIFLDYPNSVTPDYPYVSIGYFGNTNSNTGVYSRGTAKVKHPETGQNIIAPYTQEELTFRLSITANSGENSLVQRGIRPSSSKILGKIRSKLPLETTLKDLCTEMSATVIASTDITPQYSLDTTTFHNSSVMFLTFTMISTEYQYDLSGCSYFDTIIYGGDLTHKS